VLGSNNAKKLLQEIGGTVPNLVSRDESKLDFMPEVELNPRDEFWVDRATLKTGQDVKSD
jgi:hypothetical protein